MHMINISTDYDAWAYAEHDDLWVFDKLIVARKAGHICGPRGMRVPKPGMYMIRPVTNFRGMGLAARRMYIEDTTDHMHPGEFWCEYFTGDHLSVDYRGFEPVLSVKGEKHPQMPYQRFVSWEKVDETVPLPQMLVRMCLRYKFVNCEFIGGKLIEIHLRGNPDFRHGNSKAIAVWPGDSVQPPEGFRFIRDTDEDDRIGLFVN